MAALPYVPKRGERVGDVWLRQPLKAWPRNIATARLYDRRKSLPEDSPTFRVSYLRSLAASAKPGGDMAGRTVTRADLYRAAYRMSGIREREARALVEELLAEITNTLMRGEPVKLASFGTFSTRRKGERTGRNPKTGEVVLIAPRAVVVFRPSHILKGRIRYALAEKEPPGQRRFQSPAPEPAAQSAIIGASRGRRTARRSG